MASFISFINRIIAPPAPSATTPTIALKREILSCVQTGPESMKTSDEMGREIYGLIAQRSNGNLNGERIRNTAKDIAAFLTAKEPGLSIDETAGLRAILLSIGQGNTYEPVHDSYSPGAERRTIDTTQNLLLAPRPSDYKKRTE